VPIIFVGAGTGIAPMRSLILERAAIRFIAQRGEENDTTSDSKTDYGDMPVMSDSSIDENENVLVFGCRKKKTDYYYEREWETLRQDSSIRILTAFSQDQQRKIYVQKVLRDADDGLLIVKHILERGGAIYIAGNPKMARAVKQEIVEVLSDTLPGGEKQTNQLLKKMQRIGRFNVEAWS
jgi:sulfite reductase alpha subunit-like flavoprotein